MKAVTKMFAGAVGFAALVGAAAPATAQYYPGYPPQGGNVIGQVLGAILNPQGQQQYGYRMNSQHAVNQCSAAVQQRLAQTYRANYNPYGYGYGYNNNAHSSARVLNVTRVEPRSRTTTRVRGYATSGRMAQPYGYGYGGYGYNTAGQADLTFKCDIDYRGYIRDIDINRRY